ncbi:MAG: hypothetical protein NZ901_11440 [Geminocystis sp.]|nr:hypothetical protein [Geminocystis sp.]HIK37660.1 hypothetical protein [Geminocystis sp. M7585_C2015_104]MCS7148784.1 hypothetical protein [Geminocystis sp.]MCX8078686.1 hypothetical protein [Geminocystis sp.]MDW8115378.1 hypothetical protein [Geminocystis sp.]
MVEQSNERAYDYNPVPFMLLPIGNWLVVGIGLNYMFVVSDCYMDFEGLGFCFQKGLWLLWERVDDSSMIVFCE